MDIPISSIAKGFRIRTVEASHIAELLRIGEETNLSPWTAAGYIDEMKHPTSLMFRLVTEQNETAGFIVGRTNINGMMENENEAEIYNIAVSAAYRGKGCGQLLFDHFKAECLQRNTSSIWLEVRMSNETAISFYQRNGFEHIHTRNHFYENPREHAMLMKLELKPKLN